MFRYILALPLWLAAAAPQADTLDLRGALLALAGATEYATAHQAPGGAIAVVDAGGQLVVVQRLDGSFPAAPEVAVGKARTAALFRKPTRDFEDLIKQGRSPMLAVAAVTSFTPLQGGLPLLKDGAVVGAIGVSGASSAGQDEEIAQAGAAAFAAGGRP